MSSEVCFTINGKQFNINANTVPIDTSLNTFIRNHAQLSGTKFMCLEGGCGACTVSAKGYHHDKKDEGTWAVNSCLLPVFSCHGLDITTTEGIGNKHKGYHEVQKRLTHFNGTQCGYCSPGMVMNMYSLLESNNGKVSMEEVENAFAGNICRCTGYRPILDGFKSMAYDASPQLIEACKDIEDLDKVCPKNGEKCNGTCNSLSTNPVKLVFGNGREWHKVYNIEDIFSILGKCGNKPYMLVNGNTAHGVYRRNKNIEIFIDISNVKSLRSHSIGKEVVVGGNMSLTELSQVLRKSSSKLGFEYLIHLANHVDNIANVAVRNVGTMAGNLSIKHAHNDFPSDLYIILQAANAKITVLDAKKKPVSMTPEEYLKFHMNKKIISEITFPNYNPKSFIFRSYKITPRAQNAHAYVNAGFLIEIKNERVQSARICYGGINHTFTHATQTEKQLKGKDLHSTQTLQAAIENLENELNPDWVLPDASPEYRKNMAVALFYKFVLSTSPKDRVKPIYQSAGILDRPLSSGIQTYDTFKDKWPVSKFVPKHEGLIQSSGEAQYSNDIPHQPGELWAAFVPATEIHAFVGQIDPKEALKIPGVHYFFSAQDIPGENNFFVMPMFPGDQPEEIFVSNKTPVAFYGQPVGVILADTFALANYATEFVKITYKRQDKAIITSLHDAYIKNAQDRFIPNDYGMKATDEGENKTKKVIGKFEMGGQYHYTMEPQTTVCVPFEDGIKVYCATQWVDVCQTAISKALKIPSNHVDMVFKRCGGAYGAKITRPPQIACAAALACHLTHRPIRFVMSLESNMAAIGKRPAVLSQYEIDTDDDGVIQKLVNNFYEETGFSANENPQFGATPFFKNCYKADRFSVITKSVTTDVPSHTWCRAPGTTEGIAMIENIMEHIARVTGKDSVKVRLANMADDHKLRPIIDDFLVQTDYYKRKAEIEEFNSKNRWNKRGIGIIPMEYGQEHFGGIPAFVAIYQSDGTVVVSHGGVEIGQGIHTKVAQVASYILQVPLENVKVKECTNVLGANSGVTGGSMTSEAVCHAVKKACEILVERIKPVRDKNENATWQEIIKICYAELIDLTAKFQFKQTQLTPYNTYGVSSAEIEIDVLTGNLQLRRVDIFEDTGESLSPSVDIGQIEGAFIMGVGYWLMEQLVFDRDNGKLLTNRTWTYKPPGAKDIPVDFRVTFLQNSNNEAGVLGSKATGEPPLCMSIVVLFALRHALESARKDSGETDPWFELDGPATAEVVFLKANSNSKEFLL